jgi:hypothetical protein
MKGYIYVYIYALCLMIAYLFFMNFIFMYDREGAALQKRLEERAREINSNPHSTYPNESWLERWWEDYAYFYGERSCCVTLKYLSHYIYLH